MISFINIYCFVALLTKTFFRCFFNLFFALRNDYGTTLKKMYLIFKDVVDWQDGICFLATILSDKHEKQKNWYQLLYSSICLLQILKWKGCWSHHLRHVIFNSWQVFWNRRKFIIEFSFTKYEVFSPSLWFCIFTAHKREIKINGLRQKRHQFPFVQKKIYNFSFNFNMNYCHYVNFYM